MKVAAENGYGGCTWRWYDVRVMWRMDGQLATCSSRAPPASMKMLSGKINVACSYRRSNVDAAPTHSKQVWCTSLSALLAIRATGKLGSGSGTFPYFTKKTLKENMQLWVNCSKQTSFFCLSIKRQWTLRMTAEVVTEIHFGVGCFSPTSSFLPFLLSFPAAIEVTPQTQLRDLGDTVSSPQRVRTTFAATRYVLWVLHVGLNTRKNAFAAGDRSRGCKRVVFLLNEIYKLKQLWCRIFLCRPAVC